MQDLVGKSVLVRTVTHYYTGKLSYTAGDDGVWLKLEDAAWIADTGRFSAALAKGELAEVEPYPGACYVSAGAVVDICEWAHELPRKVK